MGKERYCYHCFQKLSGEAQICPYCGYSPEQDEGKFPLALPHGTVLNGKYITGAVLGQGGFGVTYIARDWKEEKNVAIKEYLPDTMATRIDSHTVSAYSGQRGESFQYGMECFLKEAQTLAEFIGNPNIVRVHSYFEENGTAYFVMDYVEGTSLETYIKSHGGKISWQKAEEFLFPVMDALDAVHGKGIIHRDVTPDNILITNDGVVKLLDFGAARYSLGDKSRSLDVVLKHGFAPKEQYTRHGRQGTYTDVYTVAASFYYAVTGRKPPDSIDRLEEDELVLPSNLGIDIPIRVEEAMLKGMEVQPGDRYQSMAQFKEALTVSVQQEVLLQENVQNSDVLQGSISQENVQHNDVLQKSIPQENIQNSDVLQKSIPQENIQNSDALQKNIPQGNIQHSEVLQEGMPQDISLKNKRKWLIPAGIAGIVACLVLVVFLIKMAVPASAPSTNHFSGTTGGGTGGKMSDINAGTGTNKTDLDSKVTMPSDNSVCNIANGGLAVEDETYKYYAAGNILRVDKKTGKSDVLVNANANSLNLYEDSIYYLVSGSVYRSDKNGGDAQPVLDAGTTGYRSIYVTNQGTVYLYAENGSLLIADTEDWEPETVLSGIGTDDFTVKGNWIYYRKAKDRLFYRVKTDGTQNKALSTSYCFDPAVDGEWIYVNNFDSIKKVAVDGGQEETVYKNSLSGNIYGMNLADGTIYYYVDGDNMKKTICSVKTDGSGYKEIFEVTDEADKIYGLNLLENEVVVHYYNAGNKSMAIMAIDTETGEQKIMY